MSVTDDKFATGSVSKSQCASIKFTYFFDRKPFERWKTL